MMAHGVDYVYVDEGLILTKQFYGPRIGALFRRHTAPIHPMFFGGGQEKGRRY